jgi:hypothetical protein
MTSQRFKLLGCCIALFGCSALAAGQSSDAPAQSQQQTQPTGSANAAEELTPVAAAVKQGDREALRNMVQNGSPAEQSAAFDALHAIDPQLATDLVVTEFRNADSGSRVQSLTLLDQAGSVDNQTVTTLLREALHDQNAAVGDYALQALTRRVQSDPSVLQPGDLTGPETQTQLLAKIQLATVNHDQSSLRELTQTGDSLVQSVANATLAATDDSSHEPADHDSDDKDKTADPQGADAQASDAQASGAQGTDAQGPDAQAASGKTVDNKATETKQPPVQDGAQQ